MNVRSALSNASHRLAATGVSGSRLDAEVLLAHVLSVDRAFLLAHPERSLTTPEQRRWQNLLERFEPGEPIAYLTGTKEFFGLTFKVSPATLIPRPESELLVETALELLTADSKQLVADVGTGSGCLAVSLAVSRPNVRLIATDCSPSAIAVAKENALLHRVNDRVDFRTGNLLKPVTDGEQIDLVLANLPYLTSVDAAAPALRFEPRVALDGGSDGLDHYRALLRDIRRLSTPPNTLLLEIDPRQSNAIQALGRAAGYHVRFLADLAGRERIAILAQ